MTGMPLTSGDAASEWKAGWRRVVTGAFGYAFATLHLGSFGTLISPLSAELEWSRAQISGAILLVALSAVITGPFVGSFCDRYGAKRIALVGVFAYSASLSAIGLWTTDLLSWYVLWSMLALAYACVSPLVWSSSIVSVFRTSRGLALGCTLCGSGFSLTFLPLVTAWGLGTIGWRDTYVVMAVAGFAVMLPLVLVGLDDSRGPAKREPKSAVPHAASDPAGPVHGTTFREALLSWRFWALSFAMMIAGLLTVGFNVHLQAAFTDAGMSVADAAALAGIGGPTLILARIGIGFLLDRFRGPGLGATIIAMPAIAMGLLSVFSGSKAEAIMIVCFVTVAYGAEADIVGYFVSRYFGFRAFGAIYGSILGILSIGAGLGSTLIALAYDRFGTYASIAPYAALGLLAAAALIVSLGGYPDRPEDSRRPARTRLREGDPA